MKNWPGLVWSSPLNSFEHSNLSPGDTTYIYIYIPDSTNYKSTASGAKNLESLFLMLLNQRKVSAPYHMDAVSAFQKWASPGQTVADTCRHLKTVADKFNHQETAPSYHCNNPHC